MKKLLLASAAFGLAASASPSFAQQIIAPTSGVIDAGGPGFGSLSNTFDQSGLSSNYVNGVTDFDTFIASDPTHTITFSGFEWFSNSGSTSAQVTYDLGSAFDIDRLALWNEESSGIGTLELFSSLDGTTFNSFGVFSPIDNPIGSNYSAEVFSFSAINTRFVRFGMSNCPQQTSTFDACAIGEVAFRAAAVNAAVPEPATWAMMLLGFLAVGGVMRQSNRKQKLSVTYA